ncbi:MAG: threonine synthase [Clostridiales bacterium]|nr:threonine synthase [Clostridiales bacterium]
MLTQYVSTRGKADKCSASQAILTGLANDGGLYVPEIFPKIDNLTHLLSLSYQDLAINILKLFLTDYSSDELKSCVYKAYDEKFDSQIIAPLEKRGEYYFLELFHGPTLAFKDMALSFLPRILKLAAKKHDINKKIVILTATSGDTGKAALEGFAHIEGVEIFVFFPSEGVSSIQKLQMQTQAGENTHVIAVNGNFDDTQTGVKKIFLENHLENVYLSSANSINIGRLLPQIVYYFSAYAQMVHRFGLKEGDRINFTVPTGNFGNILAGYYAREMGLPIKTLLCASNDNRVLYDFFTKGDYDKNREFIVTTSPSMDILVSSNLERLLYHIGGSEITAELMDQLSKKGKYSFLTEKPGFAANCATQDESNEGIRRMYNDNGYILDPHTAVAYVSYRKYRTETNDFTPNIILSTANPFKFPESVCKAISQQNFSKVNFQDAFGALEILKKLSLSPAPSQIMNLKTKKVRHSIVCMPDEMGELLFKILALDALK